MSAWTQFIEPGPALLILVLAVTSQIVNAAPLDESEQSSEIEYYPVADATGCYYNFEHYDEGDRIITNEPCLNCTCHNRMLMCYLRVCPFTKAIGQDCKVEKKADQCCPVITCPEVPVQLLPQGSTPPSTAVGHLNEYGCSIDNLFYADGAKVPSSPNNPCEVCYCIRNKTACIIQECTLTGKVVEGCRPVYVDGVCCPVRYDCEHPELETTPRPLITTTTTTFPTTSAPSDCIFNNELYSDGALVKKDIPCEQCYCMRGDIVCAVQECGPTPLDKVNCTALPAKEGQCCPDTYECENISEEDLTTLTYGEVPTTQPTLITSSESSIPSETEEMATSTLGEEQYPAATERQATVAQSEEQHTTETEKDVTESVPLGTEGPSSSQPVTESATVEAFTSRVTEAVDTITSRITDIVEAITSAITGAEEEVTVQPETQAATTESKPSIVTERAQTITQEAATEGGIEATTPELTVTEKISEESVTPENEQPKPTITEKVETVTEEETATEPFELPAHDDHEEEPHEEEPHEEEPHEEEPHEEEPHEDENEIVEGSGKPAEDQHIPTGTSEPDTEDRYTRPIDQTTRIDQGTTQKPESASIHEDEEVTEEGSGALPVQTTPSSEEPQPTIQTESHVKETTVTQITTEQSIIRETTEPIGERQGTTEQTHVTDAEAQETIQPLEPEKSTEQSKLETTLVPEVVTTITEEQPHQDVTQQPEKESTEETKTDLPKEILTATTTESIVLGTITSEESITESVPSVKEPQTTPSINKEEIVTSATSEPITETEEKVTVSPQDQTPTSGVDESKLVTTTEKEDIEIITEIPTEETERPESMDHISETASSTATPPELITEPHVTEKLGEKETDERMPSKTPEICSGEECKSSQDENEVPTEVEENCTKEGCKPQQQLPGSEADKEPTVPVVCSPEQGCVAPPAQGSSDVPERFIPGECNNETGCVPDKAIPPAENCTTEQGCLPDTSSKENEIPVKISSTCDTESGCAPEQTVTETFIPTSEQCDNEGDCKVIKQTEAPELHILPDITTIESVTNESETITTEPEQSSERIPVEPEPEQPDEYGTTSPKLELTTVKSEGQTDQTISTEKDQEIVTTKSTEAVQPQISTEGRVTTAQTTVQSDLEKETATSAFDLTTALPKEEPSSSEIPEGETGIPQESDLAVSPISPEVTQAPETVLPSATESQRTEIPTYTDITGGAQSTDTESTRYPDSGIQQTTESVVAKETHEPKISSTSGADVTTESGDISITEISIPQSTEETVQTTSPEKEGVPEVTQIVPAVDENAQTTERSPEISETVAPASPEVSETPIAATESPTTASADYGETESIKSVTESQTEINEISEGTPSHEISESTTSLIEESQGTELPKGTVSEGTTRPEKISETPEATEIPVSEHTQIPDRTVPHEYETPKEDSSVTPTESSPEISETTEQITSKPIVTEGPISATESEIEATSEAEQEHGIPGEGSCLVDGQTYTNNSYVPPINQCQTSCKCLSSILQCQSIPCTPPPNNLQCTPIFHSPDACCPVYSCSVPGVTSMESDSHVVETTTVSQEEEALVTTGSPVITSEGDATPAIITEKIPITSTVQIETETGGIKENEPTQSVSESHVTEQLPTESTATPDHVETTASHLTTEEKAVTETGTVISVTETETKERPGSESQTIIPQAQSTTAEEGLTSTPSLIPSKEQVPSHDEVENEIPEEPVHCTADSCAPVRPTELPKVDNITSLPEVSQSTEPDTTKHPEVTDQGVTEGEENLQGTTPGTVTIQEEISEQTGRPQIPEKESDVSVTTEGPISLKPIEEVTEVPLTEQPQDEILTEKVTGTSTESSGFEKSPETTTEVESESSSKTPEEIAAVPEIEEAVTTSSVIGITEPTLREQTTVRAEGEITTERQPEFTETSQVTDLPGIEVTVRPQFDISPTPIEGVTEDLETSPQPAITTEGPIDHIETTQAVGITSPDTEHITKSDVSVTTSPLETEAHVTEIIDRETEQPKDVTQVAVTESVPESTSKEGHEEITTGAATESAVTSESEKLPEEVFTQRITTVQEQPSKQEQEEPATAEPTTPTSEIVQTSTERVEESETEKERPVVTEETIVPDKQPEVSATESEIEVTTAEIGEFPTHAVAKNETEIEYTSPVTEIEEATTTAPVKSTEEKQATVVPEIESAVTTEKEEPTYTSPQLTTQGPLNASELYTSGPKLDHSTKKSVEGELSTSIPITPVSTSEPTTSATTHAPTSIPDHDIPGEHVPELPDYASPADDYEDEEQSPLGPGTCRYGGKVYVSAQQIPRDDPCDFCFCFRSDIICLQQSCPPPIPRCHEEPIRGFCCPRYECPVGMATAVNVTTSTTTTTTTLPPHFLSHAYTGRVSKSGCQIKGRAYQVGDVIPSASGPCLHCTCGGDGEMKCDPKACSPEPMLRQMIAAAVSRRRR